MAYVYAHFRASDKTCFYVGKGNGERVNSRDNRNIFWHRTVKKHGMIAVKLKEFETDEEAYEHEKKTIKAYRESGHKLVNVTDGGGGPSGFKFSDESRAKLRAIRACQPGRPHSIETREKISLSRKGKACSDEQRAVLLKNANNQSVETREKIAASSRGRKHSEETKVKIGFKHKGKIVSDKTRLKMSESQKGSKKPKNSERWKDPLYKAMMSERLKAGWAAKRANKEASNG